MACVNSKLLLLFPHAMSLAAWRKPARKRLAASLKQNMSTFLGARIHAPAWTNALFPCCQQHQHRLFMLGQNCRHTIVVVARCKEAILTATL